MQVVKKNVTLAYFNLYLQMFLDCQNQLNYSFFNLLLKIIFYYLNNLSNWANCIDSQGKDCLA